MTDETQPKTLGQPNVQIQWDDSQMESLYANIATATANREEFFMLFGMHKNWRGVNPEGGDLEVNLSKRVVMSPFAAKRMAMILAQAIDAYEKQYGKINI